MKKLICFLILMISITAFGNCNVEVSSRGANGDILSKRFIRKKIKQQLGDFGLEAKASKSGDYELYIHYIWHTFVGKKIFIYVLSVKKKVCKC